mmetsp:Transcript_63112/g.93633  ORF Transcript_63112/g.93633 Transcript_63112/m.93633 type:complete len:101 (-) Transcript_63112:69-371(-)
MNRSSITYCITHILINGVIIVTNDVSVLCDVISAILYLATDVRQRENVRVCYTIAVSWSWRLELSSLCRLPLQVSMKTAIWKHSSTVKTAMQTLLRIMAI